MAGTTSCRAAGTAVIFVFCCVEVCTNPTVPDPLVFDRKVLSCSEIISDKATVAPQRMKVNQAPLFRRYLPELCRSICFTPHIEHPVWRTFFFHRCRACEQNILRKGRTARCLSGTFRFLLGGFLLHSSLKVCSSGYSVFLDSRL